jgi:hypothetical protein
MTGVLHGLCVMTGVLHGLCVMTGVLHGLCVMTFTIPEVSVIASVALHNTRSASAHTTTICRYADPHVCNPAVAVGSISVGSTTLVA